LKILFLGTSEFARPSLEILLRSPHQVAAVVTQPDRPKGRGQKLIPASLKTLALTKHIPVFQPEKIQEPLAVKCLRSLAPDLMVVVAYGQILPSSILSIPPRGCVNVHASLLPQYRGAAPIPRAILNGEKQTGVSTMLLDAGMDTGPILLTAATEIGLEDTAGTLHDRLSLMGADLLLKTITGSEKGLIIPRPQDHSQATYAPKIERELARINWPTPAVKLFNHLRAFDPWPGAFTTLNGRLLKLFHPLFPQEMEESPREVPGTISWVQAGDLGIATSHGYLAVRELQLEGRPRMSVADFLRGHPLKIGLRLGD